MKLNLDGGKDPHLNLRSSYTHKGHNVYGSAAVNLPLQKVGATAANPLDKVIGAYK
ncbi:hypothetical protein DZE40_001783 [Clostridium beijerinckii]|uniref:Uncharacterized protein n=1 Tax=Clostridium beijerinckii TaxID=1520 RepID=A0A1S8SDN7_CLOBE|nr:hypothetical protein [Clostridium beijerinckii]OOM63342.1 hypothetical protein CLBCK_10230 [Clostridium beijerinckii]